MGRSDKIEQIHLAIAVHIGVGVIDAVRKHPRPVNLVRLTSRNVGGTSRRPQATVGKTDGQDVVVVNNSIPVGIAGKDRSLGLNVRSRQG